MTKPAAVSADADLSQLHLRLQDKLSDGSAFSRLRADQKIYVDKTACLYQLAATTAPHFLSRPRRFGKSTLISTLKELFEHGVKPYGGHDSYFKGLAIEKLWQDESVYKVMQVDFALLSVFNEASALERSFSEYLDSFAKSCGMVLDPEVTLINLKFNQLLERMPDRSLVLLVDEYDAPLTKFLNAERPEEYEKAVEILRSFYAVLKNQISKFRCIFITGITRYKDTLLFTQGNTVKDISLEPQYASICGYTRDEIREYYAEHLQLYAARLFKLPLTAVAAEHIDKLLSKMARWYDGYCFDRTGRTKVFSPWSVQQFFANPNFEFLNYWYEAAGTPTLLRKALSFSNHAALLPQLVSRKLLVKQDDFLSPASLQTMQPEVLLYQTGYLTLKRGFSTVRPDYVHLGLPNHELELSVNKLLLMSLFTAKTELPKNQDLYEAIKRQDLPALVNLFNTVLQSVDYEHNPLTNETAVAFFLQIYLHCSGLKPVINPHQADGRADLVVHLGRAVTLCIELKYCRSSAEKDLDAMLTAAVEQLQQHHYGDTVGRNPVLWQAALVFGAQAKRMVRAQTAAVISSSRPQKCPADGGMGQSE